MVYGIFSQLCPNCGRDWPFSRAEKGLLCENCGSVCSKPEKLRDYCSFLLESRKMEEMFKNAVGFSPYALQKAWIRRFLLNRSFGIVAPTGIGKSTIGLFLSLFRKRSLVLVPTVLLANQSYKRVKEMAERLGIEKEISLLHGKVKERKTNADIVVSTTSFFSRHWEEMGRFDYVFVDDVDAFLKASKNVERVLRVMGYSDEEIAQAYERVKKMLKGEKVEVNSLCKGLLIFSSATARARGIKPFLLYHLLGFSVGKSASTLRNVVDMYKMFEEKDFFEMVRKLKDGVLIFLSAFYGKEKVDELVNKLNEMGVSAVPYYKIDDEVVERFKRGEISALVGIASYNNPLARGIDIPERAKYALFYGVPRFEFFLKDEIPLYALKVLLSSIYKLNRDIKAISLLRKLNKFGNIDKVYQDAVSYVRENVERYVEELNKMEDVALYIEKDSIRVLVGDVSGYLQASGRTSRMYAGGITKGLSLLYVDEQKAFRSLEKRLRWFKEGKAFIPFDEALFFSLVDEIEKERKHMSRLGGSNIEIKMAVVESPNKVRTIAKMFNDMPVRRKISNLTFYEFSVGNNVFILTSTIGHLFDLSVVRGDWGILWEEKPIPIYTTIKRCGDKQYTDEIECEGEVNDKIDIIKGLVEASWEVDGIVILSDPDTEGEKIAYDVYAYLRPFVKNILRGEMHSITRKEFLRAVSHTREVDERLVKAQQVRRIADRVVGFKLSSLAQRFFKSKNYSVGRVQTPVLGWIIDRWKENRKKVEKWFLEFDNYLVELERKPSTEKIEVLSTEKEMLTPPKPFTTDELLKDANRILGFSVSKTMSLAQSLFERGLITYHRTDYTYVSPEGREVAKEYLERVGRSFVPRVWGEKGAHEAIRPTRPFSREEIVEMIENGILDRMSRDELSLYWLIFSRFIASQTKEAVVEKTTYQVGDLTVSVFTDVVDEGYLEFYKNIRVVRTTPRLIMKKVPMRPLFTQGELISLMKEKGIGRPSTYSTIVDILFKRGYIIERKGRLIPTKKGIELYSFAVSNFGVFVDENFTKELEKSMDEVEKGNVEYDVPLIRIKKELDKITSNV